LRPIIGFNQQAGDLDSGRSSITCDKAEDGHHRGRARCPTRAPQRISFGSRLARHCTARWIGLRPFRRCGTAALISHFLAFIRRAAPNGACNPAN